METTLEFKAQYADTDAYGVVWHGTYLRWMEAGRVEWLFNRGVRIEELAEKFGIVMPVVEIQAKYKMPVKLMDTVIVTTSVEKFTFASIIFHQVVKLKETGKICVIADIKATAINRERRVIKNLPELVGLDCAPDKEVPVC